MFQKRITQSDYTIDKTDCTGIYDMVGLQEHLANLKIPYPSPYLESEEPSQFHLYPYCSEETKIGGGFDEINKGVIEIPVLSALQDTFNCKFFASAGLTQRATQRSNMALFFGMGKDVSVLESPVPDTEKFFDLLKNRNKNMFVVSHSNFMSTFYKYIYDLFHDKIESSNLNESEKFDNLDIIQLQFAGEILKRVIIRRWVNSYEIDFAESLEEHTDEDFDKDTTMYTNKFIMRHCAACHNTQRGNFGKTKKVLNWMALHPEQGYLKYAICLSNTMEEMEEKAEALLSILETNGGYKNYEFGSSVVFRALLTSIMQKRQLDILFTMQTDPDYKRGYLMRHGRSGAGGRKRGRKVKTKKRKKKNRKTRVRRRPGKNRANINITQKVKKTRKIFRNK
tara:strand:- start:518 stop:1702 length:1185 start_codon:yes stop_codon:yes gene_type:complete